ncbi:hypothetical protein C7974DRAFT_421039 [Boeremia exigua]|uniref:uncharacterized protein n=1 Tax=Boeremia exigua TaxID=749465 RepID=UPI001E8E7FE3|nr:uncharacterized protein C7974DRAFT_421039 [Boeremia exigua]KAH6642811.1 hypothetical protein C7974DRAFT_421039 [Boeremia exigua]
MASLCILADELKLLICHHLDGDAKSLKNLALTSRATRDCALVVHKQNSLIDLSTGSAKVVHKVMAHLLALASDSAAIPPISTIASTGDPFADTLLKHASNFTSLKLDNIDTLREDKIWINDKVLGQYMSLISKLAPVTMYGAQIWRKRLLEGDIRDLLQLLLRVARHITTLEMSGSLEWMAQTDVRGACPALRTLKLVGIHNYTMERTCGHILRVPTLEVLEFARMDVSIFTLDFVDTAHKLSISSLHFLECYVSPKALEKAICACRTLETFRYTLCWEKPAPALTHYNIARLIKNLASHSTTLKHVTILTSGVLLRNTYRDSDGLAQLEVLRTLAISHDLLHPLHVNADAGRRKPRQLKKLSKVLLSLKPSLQRLELHDCDKTSVTKTLLDVMHQMADVSPLPNLCTIKVVSEPPRHPLPHELQELEDLTRRIGGLGRSQALREAAARTELHLELDP